MSTTTRAPLSTLNKGSSSRLPIKAAAAPAKRKATGTLRKPAASKAARTTSKPASASASASAASTRGGRSTSAASARKPIRKPGATSTATRHGAATTTTTTSRTGPAKRGAKATGGNKWSYDGKEKDMEALVERMLEEKLARQTATPAEPVTVVDEAKLKALQAELTQLKALHATELDTLGTTHRSMLQAEQAAKATLQRLHDSLEADLALARQEVSSLKGTVSKVTTEALATEAQLRATKASLEATQDTVQTHSDSIAALEATKAELLRTIEGLEAKSRSDEATRRKLHNTIQELKGNVRVFCRVRPLLGDERTASGSAAPEQFAFPGADGKMLEFTGPSEANYAGKIVSKNYEFEFDKVFPPTSSQETVFEEISQLVQSALDGYNVCIFAYGQTGSGKTFTMEGGSSLSTRGMIPRAVEQVFATAGQLGTKGWEYEFQASILEIYNETIRDLLTADPSAKHTIKKMRGQGDVVVTGLTLTGVESDAEVEALLATAAKNRAVAATDMNARSSRGHCVFRLHIAGTNKLTGDSCRATLNLIDLAGSERLSSSGAQGERLKETQSINKSLSNLGNVIMALGNKDSHVPYRNSKLTYLLQNSLGGNSKSLMFVNVSPVEESAQETLCSLRFATKVNQCSIGTARKVAAKPSK